MWCLMKMNFHVKQTTSIMILLMILLLLIFPLLISLLITGHHTLRWSMQPLLTERVVMLPPKWRKVFQQLFKRRMASHLIHHQMMRCLKPPLMIFPLNHPTNRLGDYQLIRDRERRAPKPNPKYSLLSYADLIYTALVAACEVQNAEPVSFSDAMSSKNCNNWKTAMDEEMTSLKDNKTWVLVPRPEKARIIDCKWIYKIKEGISKSDPIKFKARLVAKGFSQKEGLDYNEIFSPVVKFKTIRLMLAVTAFYDLELEQMDVKTKIFEW
ncbi:hypothetical protein Dimus_038428 [Dionaea muscipula]